MGRNVDWMSIKMIKTIEDLGILQIGEGYVVETQRASERPYQLHSQPYYCHKSILN